MIPCYAAEIALKCHASGDMLEKLDYTMTSTEDLGDLLKVELTTGTQYGFTTEGDSPTITITDPVARSFSVNKQIVSWPPKPYVMHWTLTFANAGPVTMYYTNWTITEGKK